MREKFLHTAKFKVLIIPLKVSSCTSMTEIYGELHRPISTMW